jgi:hypothetical protein
MGDRKRKERREDWGEGWRRQKEEITASIMQLVGGLIDTSRIGDGSRTVDQSNADKLSSAKRVTVIEKVLSGMVVDEQAEHVEETDSDEDHGSNSNTFSSLTGIHHPPLRKKSKCFVSI